MPSPRPEIQVIQSNYLIRSTADIENNSFQMSAIQKRTFLYIINQINEQENTHNPLGDNWISINPYQMVKAIIPSKPNGNDMNHVWQALSELRGDKYHIIIKYFLDGVLRERRTNLVLEIDRIVTASNEINIHIPDLIHKHTKQLKSNFTKLNLTYSVVLKSFNQIRAYELFSSYSYLGNWTVSINHFRELMEIKPSQYKAFAFLKKQVIDICVSATGDRTNLVVSYEIIREGKKPVEISFSIVSSTTSPLGASGRLRSANAKK
jgi:plasmid replication initiation protein